MRDEFSIALAITVLRAVCLSDPPTLDPTYKFAAQIFGAGWNEDGRALVRGGTWHRKAC